MQGLIERMTKPPLFNLLSVLLVMFGIALGHSIVVLQWQITGGVSLLDSLVSLVIGSAGVVLVWRGLSRPELPATLMGYLGGNLIWVGFFEWTWHAFGHWLQLEPVVDKGFEILAPGLQVIQATTVLVVIMLIFLGSNKDTRCRMFLWFHRNLKIRPGQMTAGYKRQFSRIAAMETVFLIWAIYLFAIAINDPRLIRYDSTAAVVITLGFLAWALYLVRLLLKQRGPGATFRYAIATGSILWLPTEAFSYWGLYTEVWVKPAQFPWLMGSVAVLFVLGMGLAWRAAGRSAGQGMTQPA